MMTHRLFILNPIRINDNNGVIDNCERDKGGGASGFLVDDLKSRSPSQWASSNIFPTNPGYENSAEYYGVEHSGDVKSPRRFCREGSKSYRRY